MQCGGRRSEGKISTTKVDFQVAAVKTLYIGEKNM